MTYTEMKAEPSYKFAVTAPKDYLGPDAGRYVVSRHLTRAAAERAAKGKVGFEVMALCQIRFGLPQA